MEEIISMTKFIKNFRLEDCPSSNKGYERVLLQLFGFLGHGKSSFINSCKYVLGDGEFQTYADVTQNDGGNTTSRISYPLTDTLTLVDNRGCSVMDNYELGEVYAQLGNLLPIDCPVQWTDYKDLMKRIVQAENIIKSSDFIYPIFEYSVKKGITDAEIEELKKLLDTAKRLTGIFPMVVLTHGNHSNFSDVKAKFENIRAEQIIPIENFTPEDHIKTRRKQESMLKFFIEVTEDVKFRLREFMDPEAERIQRKTFVLTFVYESNIKKEKEEFERKLRASQRRDEESQPSGGKPRCFVQ